MSFGPSSATAPAARKAPEPLCGNCRYFHGAPRDLEAQLPGMRALGSAYGSVRSGDGICSLHDRYLDPASTCASHERAVTQYRS